MEKDGGTDRYCLYIRANLGWMDVPQEEEVVKGCGDNWVNHHLQREHGEPGTWHQRATKAIYQQELSLGRTPMAQGQLNWISANTLVTHLPGVLERERPGGSQKAPPATARM